MPRRRAVEWRRGEADRYDQRPKNTVRWEKRPVESGGIRFAARDSGGEGTTIVLVHGLGFGRRTWHRVAPRLSARGLRVVAYDQRGHGASSTSQDYSLGAFVRDLAAVVVALAIEEPLLVGHSLGAAVVVEYAATRGGCSGVVCVDGGFPAPMPEPDWGAIEATMRRPTTRLALWVTKLARVGSGMSFAEQRHVAEEYDATLPRLDAAYEQMACPVMLVAASRADRVPQGEQMRAALAEGVENFRERHPGARVERLPCGHNVPWECPGDLAELIAAFIHL
jgi:pimeloyl-ACP methyl ester carboxylesterase